MMRTKAADMAPHRSALAASVQRSVHHPLLLPSSSDATQEGIWMEKQSKSAAELAGMVEKMIGVHGLQVVVNPDPVEGWRPRAAHRR
jgi:lipoate-protein ligase B